MGFIFCKVCGKGWNSLDLIDALYGCNRNLSGKEAAAIVYGLGCPECGLDREEMNEIWDLVSSICEDDFENWVFDIEEEQE